MDANRTLSILQRYKKCTEVAEDTTEGALEVVSPVPEGTGTDTTEGDTIEG